MEQLLKLKSSVKALAYAIKDADDEMPSNAEIETLIDRGCDVFCDAVALVKAIWSK
jgi:hypothetical protein